MWKQSLVGVVYMVVMVLLGGMETIGTKTEHCTSSNLTELLEKCGKGAGLWRPNSSLDRVPTVLEKWAKRLRGVPCVVDCWPWRITHRFGDKTLAHQGLARGVPRLGLRELAGVVEKCGNLVGCTSSPLCVSRPACENECRDRRQAWARGRWLSEDKRPSWELCCWGSGPGRCTPNRTYYDREWVYALLFLFLFFQTIAILAYGIWRMYDAIRFVTGSDLRDCLSMDRPMFRNRTAAHTEMEAALNNWVNNHEDWAQDFSRAYEELEREESRMRAAGLGVQGVPFRESLEYFNFPFLTSKGMRPWRTRLYEPVKTHYRTLNLKLFLSQSRLKSLKLAQYLDKETRVEKVSGTVSTAHRLSGRTSSSPAVHKKPKKPSFIPLGSQPSVDRPKEVSDQTTKADTTTTTTTKSTLSPPRRRPSPAPIPAATTPSSPGAISPSHKAAPSPPVIPTNTLIPKSNVHTNKTIPTTPIPSAPDKKPTS